MAAKIYYEKDAPIDALKGKKVAVIGYGSQGHAHSLNLRDSGIEVTVAELQGTDNFKLAQEHGFTPGDIKTAMDGATLIIVTLPDEVQAKVYADVIGPNLVAGQTLGFCHGFISVGLKPCSVASLKLFVPASSATATSIPLSRRFKLCA